MSVTVQFEEVSKLYNLGLTRTSLPTMAADWARQKLRRQATPSTAKSREFWALREVSFQLKQRESLALIGPNGAGKTTILKLLAKITKPTSGTIKSHGQLSALIELGAGFHSDLTGRENIFLNGTILGLSRRQIQQRFDEIVDFSELEQFIDTPVKRYSSGMIVRLGFAVASCIEPEILLVDEVLAVGDVAFQQKCLNRIHQLIDGGTSIIFVSHNFYLIQAVCNRALYIDHGQVKHDSSVNEVIELYERDLHLQRAQRYARTNAGQEAPEEIDVTKVEVLNGCGEAAPFLRSDEPAQVQVHYTAYRDMGRLHLSVLITRSDGLTTCQMRTKLDDVCFDIRRGNGVVTVEMNPLQLISGTYYAEGSFLNSTDSMAISTRYSEWFTVQGAGFSYEASGGVYEPRTQWRIAADLPGALSPAAAVETLASETRISR